MSWLPSNDPVLGDKQSCDALELVIVPRVRDLGGFEVRRALPSGKRQMVGPFIFFDQMGPVQFIAGQGMDVRPHPHIGLAGRGIAHSERTPKSARNGNEGAFGIQSWIALPEAYEETDPSFQHFDAASLPVIEDRGLRARIIAGSAFGRKSPVGMLSEWLYADVTLEAGASAPFDPDQDERGIYVVEGEIDIAGETFEAPRLLIFRPGDLITVRATRRARLMFLGGSAMEGPRYIWWNFVSSRRERIEQAKEEWKSGRFKPVPGETEFIPLPEK